MTGKESDSEHDVVEREPSCCRLNGVTVNITTGLLAVAVLAGTIVICSIGYWFVPVDTADMTIRPAPTPISGPVEAAPPADLPD